MTRRYGDHDNNQFYDHQKALSTAYFKDLSQRSIGNSRLGLGIRAATIKVGKSQIFKGDVYDAGQSKI